MNSTKGDFEGGYLAKVARLEGLEGCLTTLTKVVNAGGVLYSSKVESFRLSGDPLVAELTHCDCFAFLKKISKQTARDAGQDDQSIYVAVPQCRCMCVAAARI
jgi:hypothetical protein